MGAQWHKLTYFSEKGCVIDCNSVVFCLDIFKSIKRRTFETSSEEEKIKTGWRRSANLFMEDTIILFCLFESGKRSDYFCFLIFST